MDEAAEARLPKWLRKLEPKFQDERTFACPECQDHHYVLTLHPGKRGGPAVLHGSPCPGCPEGKIIEDRIKYDEAKRLSKIGMAPKPAQGKSPWKRAASKDWGKKAAGDEEEDDGLPF